MRKVIIVILLSLIFAILFISGGYGLWSEMLTIEVDIDVLPDPEHVLAKREELENMLGEMERPKLNEFDVQEPEEEVITELIGIEVEKGGQYDLEIPVDNLIQWDSVEKNGGQVIDGDEPGEEEIDNNNGNNDESKISGEVEGKEVNLDHEENPTENMN
ncbi:MAG: hypothetical protein GXY88_07495 [Tissierellia bacterium]|nr:hypothetical protein [Tissierellia bacterium]